MTKRLGNKILSLLVPGLAVLLCFSVSPAQDKELKKIRWGVTSISASNWIPWIAKEAKIYDKNGLDVELILLRGSGQTSQAIISGSIFAAPVTLATVMLARTWAERTSRPSPIPSRACRANSWCGRRSNGPKT
jgi:ABC-type nitrate/sulfonate/bicarbonate transport system substrate-binding protein